MFNLTFFVIAFIVSMILFALVFHYSYSIKNRQIIENDIYVYSQGKTAFFEAILFFKVNHLKNNPRGLWLIFECAWPLIIALLIGIYLISSYASVFDNKNLALADLLNQKAEEGSIHPASKSPTNSSPEKSEPQTTNSRDPSSTINIDPTQLRTHEGKYSFLIIIWMGFMMATFTNFLVKSRSHAEKWTFCNKALLEILNDVEPISYSSPKWKKFAQDLLVTGMWGHRSFKSHFNQVMIKCWKNKYPDKCFNNYISEFEALRLLS